MAKSKKSESTAAKKAPAAKSKKPGAGGTPLVDTSFAAEAAARMLAGRAKLGASAEELTAESAGDKESASFKQLKEGLNKPASQTPNFLNNTLGPNKSNLPHYSGNQVAHNQTTGGFNKINVPRRTGG